MANSTGSADNVSDILANGTTSATGYRCNWPADRIYEINVENNPTLYVELIFYPILLFICTIGNILSVIVLSREITKTTTNVYLICLALSDLCVVWLALTLYIPEVDTNVFKNETYLQNMFNFRGFQVWWQETCVQFSDWTLIVFSLERLIAIAKPLEYRHRLTVRRAVYIELVVFLLAALCTLENIVMWYYLMAHDDGVSPKVKIATPALLNWEIVQNQAEVGITIGKWIILAIINIVLIVVLAKHNVIRQSVLGNTLPDSASKESVQWSTTVVLMTCVALYFVTQFPNVIYKILEVASRPPYCAYRLTYAHKNAARPFVHMSVLTNYSVNFLLYCLVWTKFRNQLRNLVSGAKEKLGISDSTTTQTSPISTPAGFGMEFNSRGMPKRSLECPDAVQFTISPLLAAERYKDTNRAGIRSSQL